jgi:hypothetical protein
MTHAGYVFAGWGLGLGVIGLYAWSVIRRGRALSRHVAPERRRWMTSDAEPDSAPHSDISTTDISTTDISTTDEVTPQS